MIWPRLLRVPLVRQVPLPSIGRLTRFKATKKRAPITIFQARAGGQDAGRRRHPCRCSRDRAWLPLPRVFGLKGHSLIYDTGEAVAAQALFLEHGDGRRLGARPADGTTYICGISSDSPVPDSPAEVAADPSALAQLQAIAEDVSPLLVRSRFSRGRPASGRCPTTACR
jgi:hypothetical protein